jgi:predicted nucleic acid-binding protein
VILLDTNVVSGLLRPGAQGGLHLWLDSQPAESVWVSSITAFELWNGVGRLPDGARRRNLEAALRRLLDGDLLAGRVAPVDRMAAEAAAGIAAERFRRGRPVELADTLIAGIAVARGAVLATRNLRHFADVEGLRVLDPFTLQD